MNVNQHNILALNEALKIQRDQIAKLNTDMATLQNTIAILQSELNVTKQLAAYSKGTGPTA